MNTGCRTIGGVIFLHSRLVEETRISFRSTAVLADYDRRIRSAADELGVEVEHIQTNDLEAL